MPSSSDTTKSSKEVFIVGAGAVGSFLATRLCPYSKVTLVTHNDKKNRFLKGITVNDLAGAKTYQPNVLEWSEIKKFPEQSVVFIATKAFDLQQAIIETLQRSPAKADSSHEIILCQNGLGITEAAQKLSPYRTWGRLSCWFGTSLDLGTTDNAMPIVLVAGVKGVEVADTSKIVIDLLQAAKLYPTVLESSNLLEWRKALSNITINGLCALANVKNGALLENKKLHEAACVILEEAIRVAHAEGVDLGESDEQRVFEVIQTTKENFNSTIQDLEAKRSTEVAWLNSMVVKKAQKLGLQTPANLMISTILESRV